MPDRWYIRGLHLAVLAGFAISQPMFDILQRYPTFLVTHRVGSGDILMLTLLLGVCVPAGFFLLGGLTGLFGKTPGKVLYITSLVLLAMATLLPLAHRSGMPGVFALALTAIAAGGFSVIYLRSGVVRRYMSWLALALLVFPVLFLSNGAIRTLAFGGDAATISSATIDGDTPVVLLILDEFPIVSLLDEDHRIDAVRYPHFAALAAQSHWFRNASTVAAYTEHAVPAILSGSFPGGDRLPHHEEYRQTLFTLLGGSYAMHVEEPITLLFPPQLDQSASDDEERSTAGFLGDLGVIYLHILLPADFTGGLPSVSAGWRDFGGGGSPGADDGKIREHRSNELATLDKLRKQSEQSRVDLALRYIEDISGEDPRTVHMLHVMLPHNRWRHTPSGRHYCRKGLKNPGQIGDLWPDQERYSELAWQRHLMQAETADRLLGRMVEKLKGVGLYDRALLIVTADHGASFWPGASLRSLAEAIHPPDILDVPLFVKLPGQEAGELTDRHVRTIDILPTITEVLGIGRPAGIDGYSVFDESRTAPVKRAKDSEGEFAEFDADPDLKYTTLDRKLSLFGSGEGGSIHAVGDLRALLGRPLAELDVAGDGVWTIGIDPNYFRNTAKYGKFTPVFIRGEVSGPAGPVSVAAAVNGTIQAIARTIPVDDGPAEFYLLLPEDSYGTGTVEIELLILDDGSMQFTTGGIGPIHFTQKPLPANYPAK